MRQHWLTQRNVPILHVDQLHCVIARLAIDARIHDRPSVCYFGDGSACVLDSAIAFTLNLLLLRSIACLKFGSCAW